VQENRELQPHEKTISRTVYISLRFFTFLNRRFLAL
jgi:hypothetical protein